MEPLIVFENVSLGYGASPVLTGVDFTLTTHDFLGIVGPNGAGKTTLLRGILGLLPPRSGSVTTARPRLKMGYVPQRDRIDTLFPLTVLDIVLMGAYNRLGPFARPGRADREAAREAIADTGIEALEQRPFRSLSGGQQQRALIARALMGRPDLLVLDEPTNGMDLPSEAAIMDLIQHLHGAHGMTVLMVSHNLNTVVSYARRIAVVGDGRFREGPVDAMVTADVLSALYGVRVAVHSAGGRAVVMADTAPEAAS